MCVSLYGYLSLAVCVDVRRFVCSRSFACLFTCMYTCVRVCAASHTRNAYFHVIFNTQPIIYSNNSDLCHMWGCPAHHHCHRVWDCLCQKAKVTKQSFVEKDKKGVFN